MTNRQKATLWTAAAGAVLMAASFYALGLWSYDAAFAGEGRHERVTIGMWRSDVEDLCGQPDKIRYKRTIDGTVVWDVYAATAGDERGGCTGLFEYENFKLRSVTR